MFHRPSGKTHLLNAGGIILLREVLVEPLAAAEAADRLADSQGAVADDRFRQHIDALLRRFEELGLVERIAV